MSLVVGADSAKAAFDCASGSVDLPIILDGHNRFSAAGTFRSEAGVVRPGSESPAEYAGTVTGLPGTARIMTVTITVSPTANPEFTLGPFELLEGREVTLTLCR